MGNREESKSRPPCLPVPLLMSEGAVHDPIETESWTLQAATRGFLPSPILAFLLGAIAYSLHGPGIAHPHEAPFMPVYLQVCDQTMPSAGDSPIFLSSEFFPSLEMPFFPDHPTQDTGPGSRICELHFLLSTVTFQRPGPHCPCRRICAQGGPRAVLTARASSSIHGWLGKD